MADRNTSDGKSNKESWFRRHKVLTVIGVILLIAIFANLGGGKEAASTTNNNTPASTTEEAKKPAELAKIGTAVRDGKFEFVVKSAPQCGQASVGTNQYLTKTAQGQFCSVVLSVKNIGDKPQSLFAENQKLFNAAGQEYSADSTATMYAAPEGSSTWYSEINPGNSVEGTIVFDLPKDATPVKAELHDSVASGGVEVSLQ